MANENQNSMIPDWQFNTIPGNANQGSILMTRNVLTEPPLSLDDLIWIEMKDVIGTADVKLEYSEEENKYILYKAKGHRENNGEWIKDWIFVGSWEPITEEVAEALRSLVYIQYIFDTTTLNTLKVIGLRKDGTQDELCNINFATKTEFDSAVLNLNNRIDVENVRATNAESALANNIEAETTRATTAEAQLQTNITTAQTQLQANINAEVNRATAKEEDLQNQINDNKENLADYIGSFETKAALEAYSGEKNNNDYAVVLNDETHNNQCWRYIYRESTNSWLAQYMVNEEPMTQAQVDAINSGINAAKVAQVEQNRLDIANINTEIGELQEELIEGNGINITNNVISVKNGNGITVDSTGVKAKGNANAGIDVNSNGIGIKINSTNLKFSSGSLDTVLQTWTGTQAEYDALGTYDSNTLYLITED